MNRTRAASLALPLLLLSLCGCQGPQLPTAPGAPTAGLPTPPSGMPSMPGGPPTASLPRPPSEGARSGKSDGDSENGSSGSRQDPNKPSSPGGGGVLPSPSIFEPGAGSGQSPGERRRARKEAGEALQEAGAEIWARKEDLPSSAGTGNAGPSRSAQADDDPLAPVNLPQELPPEVAAELRQTLEEASAALQEAGIQLAGAETDAELAAAAAALGEARLGVLVASQELADAQDIYGAPGSEAVFQEVAEVLDQARLAVVIASRTAPMALPGLPPGGAPPGESELEQELNESIAIYEGQLRQERRKVLGDLPPGKSAAEVPSEAVLGAPTGAGRQTTLRETQPGGAGSMPVNAGGAQVAKAGQQGAPQALPDDLPSAQGDDIVAQQLREAAIAEQDPALREKLWEEYRKYKEGL